MINVQDTICAIATAPGCGAIAIIRLSGNRSIEITDSIFKSPSGKKLIEQKANTVHFGQILRGNDIVDEVLVSLFKAPHSFTGEDSVEISCHGSRYIQSEILKLLIIAGCRMAEPGEFSKRAFLNGKMDLSQAEAVADLIASTSSASHKMAMNQMRGGFSHELNKLREGLLTLTSLLELELDFSEEDVEFADREQLRSICAEIDEKLGRLCSSFSVGNAIKSGVPVAIVGPANAGKSTLLNRLLNDDKAIVSEVAGTTRDVIEDTAVFNGITFRFIDTAGIRATNDKVESLGIERTFAKIEQAQIVLLLFPSRLMPGANVHAFGSEGSFGYDDDDDFSYGDSGDGGYVGFCGEDSRLEYTELIRRHMNPDAHLVTLYTKADKLHAAAAEIGAAVSFESEAVNDAASVCVSEIGCGSVENEFATSEECKRITSPINGVENLTISAKTGQGIDALIDILTSFVDTSSIAETDIIVSNLRHYEALRAGREAIERVADGLRSGLPGDLIAQDLRECLMHLGTITGTITTDDLLGNIFKHFCIGK